MGVKQVNEKLISFQASYEMDSLNKLTLGEISSIVEKFGFDKEDLPVLREMMCEKQVGKNQEGGRSSTRKNRLKKKRNKKNKTQRGGDEGVWIMVGVTFGFVSLVMCCLALPEPRGSAVLNRRLTNYNHGDSYHK